MRRRKGIAIAAVILVLCSAVCILYKPVYYRLYPFDRIQGNIQVTVDGQACTLSEESFTDCRRVKPQNDGSAHIGIKAGEYGAYAFLLNIEELEQPVTVRCYQHNWWNVWNLDLQVHIDTQHNNAVISGTATDLDDHGRKNADSVYLKYDLAEEIRLSFGP